jgi:DNA repair protein RecO (recombination protein O)
VPLYTADALILRTYKLGEADRIVVFLTRDRGKKRGVAKGARRPRSRFVGALEPLTEVRVAYFEKERRELVGLNYAETVRSPLELVGGPVPGGGPALGYVSYFAELLDEWAQDADADERLYRLGVSMLTALSAGAPAEPLARYFEYWLLRLQGVYPEARGTLSPPAMAFLAASRSVGPDRVRELPAERRTLKELEQVHRGLIALHLEKHLKSDRVLRDLRRQH